jgi:tetratricopeptide (TPR) repeat protein
MSRGITLRNQGNLAEAIRAYGLAWEFLEAPSLREHRELDDMRAQLKINCGVALWTQGDVTAAITAYDEAWQFLERPHLREHRELDTNRALLKGNLGNALYMRRDLPAAIEAYRSAWQIYQGPHLRSRQELDDARAMVQMHSGVVLWTQGDFNGADNAYRSAWQFLEAPSLKMRRELDVERAKVQANWGNTLVSINRLDGAISAYRTAWHLLDSPVLRARQELDPDRAQIQMYWGNALSRQGKTQAAIEAYRRSWSLYEGPSLRDRRELDHDRAKVQFNLGSVLLDCGQPAEALEMYQSAKHYYDTELAARDYLDEDRCRLYSSMARTVLDRLPNPRDWLLRHSTRMVEILELCPTALDPGSHDPYALMRGFFEDFHRHWVAFCLEQQAWDDLLRILSIVQGRELAARLLDSLDDADSGTTRPAAIQAFQAQRRKLRAISEEIEHLSNSRGSGIQVSGLESSPESTRSAVNQQEAEAKLHAKEQEYTTLRAELPGLREAAAREPGFEALRQPYTELDVAALRRTLAENEALLILIDARLDIASETFQLGLLIKSQGGARVHLFVNIDRVALAARRLNAQTHSVRHYRRGFRPHEEAGAEVRPTMAEIEEAWSQLEEFASERLWTTNLRRDLHEVQRLLCITHGNLHLLPLELSKPSDLVNLSLRYYPGLIFYAMRRGLLDPPQEAHDFDVSLGLLGYAGAEGDIPFAEAEVEMLAEYWKTQQPGARIIKPWHPSHSTAGARARNLHIACHGTDGVEPGGFGREPVLEIGEFPGETRSSTEIKSRDPSNGVLSMRSVRRLATPPREVYLSACFGGHTREDLSGDPIGFVSSFFERGVHLVIGSVFGVPDEWAPLLALLTYQSCAYQSLTLDDAFDEAKKRIQTGVWYDDTEIVFKQHITPYLCRREDVRALAESCFQEMRVCELLEHEWIRITSLTSVTPDGREILHRAQAVEDMIGKAEGELGPSKIKETLEVIVAEFWAEAMITRRIPTAVDLLALVHGFRIYGEGRSQL